MGAARSKPLAADALLDKVVLITGANSGIGLGCARSLALAGATVVMACRSASRGEAAKASMALPAELAARVSVLPLDLASLQSVAAFAEAFREKFLQLDVLILNAGLAGSFLGSGGFAKTKDGLEEMVGVNFLGHYLLTRLLLPVLRATPGARVIGLTSVAMANSYLEGIDVASWTSRRRDFQDWMQYGQSKLAVRLFVEELQRREPSLLCLACHPGVVAGTALMHQGGSFLESLYSWFTFNALAMRADFGHLNTVYVASAPASELRPGACYLPVGREMSWKSHWFQRACALQMPLRMQTEHPTLWSDAERLLIERRAPLSLSARNG